MLLRLRQGAESPRPVDGITGYECPNGTYCPVGSSFPLGCAPGTYNPSEAMGECTECLPGSICPGNSTAPEECPIYHYCPAGSATGVTCPAGTHGSRVRAEFPARAIVLRLFFYQDGVHCLTGSFGSEGAERTQGTIGQCEIRSSTAE